MYTRDHRYPTETETNNESRIQGDLMNFFAYLDPGTGTLIVQAVLGGAAGVAVLFKTMGNKFKRSKPNESTDAVEADDVGEPTVPAPSTD
jgi:hypothetical protein